MARTTALKNLMVKTSVLTAGKTLTDSDSGRTFFLSATTGFTIELPAPRGGINFEFIIKTAPTSGNYLISTKGDSDIIVGQSVTVDVNSGTDPDFATGTKVNDINFVANVAVVGDSLKLTSDGTYWYAEGFSSVYNAITFD